MTPSRSRVFHIDMLRAIAILGVMVTHSLSLYLNNPATTTIWNYLHFVVVGFVLCSGYVTYRSWNQAKQKNLGSWYGKRFVRLYIPFLIYLFGYALLVYMFPSLFRGWTITFSAPFFLSSIFLTGGLDFGWLTILFIQLMLLTPVLMWIVKNTRRYYAALILLVTYALIAILFPIPSAYSRAMAWIPWSLIFLLGAGLAKQEEQDTRHHNFLLIISIESLLLHVLLHLFLVARGVPQTLTLHKYPPDLFYFSYGIGIASAILWIVETFNKKIDHQPLVTFFSKHSYAMFFVQLIAADFLTTTVKSISVGATTTLSIILTTGVIVLWEKIRALFSEA